MYSVRDKPEVSWDFDKKIFIKENVVSREICEEIIAYGENNVLKDVARITDGTRWALIGWAWGNNWK